MLKTCMNCAHYCTVCDANNPNMHWHNFCSLWGKILDETKYWPEDLIEFGSVWDDFETGVAECYMFKPAKAPFKSDAWFLQNRAENNRLMKRYNKKYRLDSEEDDE